LKGRDGFVAAFLYFYARLRPVVIESPPDSALTFARRRDRKRFGADNAVTYFATLCKLLFTSNIRIPISSAVTRLPKKAATACLCCFPLNETRLRLSTTANKFVAGPGHGLN
jgi:hypothetical protein